MYTVNQSLWHDKWVSILQMLLEDSTVAQSDDNSALKHSKTFPNKVPLLHKIFGISLVDVFRVSLRGGLMSSDDMRDVPFVFDACPKKGSNFIL